VTERSADVFAASSAAKLAGMTGDEFEAAAFVTDEDDPDDVA
jgi:hypothetical protein